MERLKEYGISRKLSHPLNRMGSRDLLTVSRPRPILCPTNFLKLPSRIAMRLKGGCMFGRAWRIYEPRKGRLTSSSLDLSHIFNPPVKRPPANSTNSTTVISGTIAAVLGTL